LAGSIVCGNEALGFIKGEIFLPAEQLSDYQE